MAKKKSIETEEGMPEGVMPGTVEYERFKHLQREKEAYEERTGESVNTFWPTPLTSTPLASMESGNWKVESAEEETAAAEGEAEH